MRGSLDTHSARTRDSESGDPVDIHVGSRVRQRRQLLGLSQEKLAAALGLTFQQVQKYERGTNRISASRLYAISQALDVPLYYFFEEFDGGMLTPLGDDPETSLNDLDVKRDTFQLVRAYLRISDPHTKRRFFELVKSMARLVSPDENENVAD